MILVNNINKIQEIRALHALQEAGIKIYVKPKNVIKFRILKKIFNFKSITLKKGSSGTDLFDILKIDHSKPSTSIYNVKKNLIYPKEIFHHLKNKWKKNKKYDVSFSGVLTKTREVAISEWYRRNFQEELMVNQKKSFLIGIIENLSKYFPLHNFLVNKYNQFYLYFTDNGRKFPIKSWDRGYYNFLLNSKFVLCPSGDYIWTYRFFESIMCGAIPIVEEDCNAYKGFKYYKMNQNLNDLVWNEEIANHNFKLCLQRFTLNSEEIALIKNNLVKNYNK